MALKADRHRRARDARREHAAGEFDPSLVIFFSLPVRTNREQEKKTLSGIHRDSATGTLNDRQIIDTLLIDGPLLWPCRTRRAAGAGAAGAAGPRDDVGVNAA
ncbi:hypothetical protein EVAR_33103_1 [Eumeta japonica]|uniref:Uncharacterized protein n=1 Tax=Eumeta variegata TaxID=151549 RepID=A0A4C1YC51_EUMVA|nr:hypothetical protein EVAR_33103_1 [Eumeta japonica]